MANNTSSKRNKEGWRLLDPELALTILIYMDEDAYIRHFCPCPNVYDDGERARCSYKIFRVTKDANHHFPCEVKCVKWEGYKY